MNSNKVEVDSVVFNLMLIAISIVVYLLAI